VVFQPVIRNAVLEREQVAVSNASFKARIYSQDYQREITLKGDANSRISCSGGFSYIGIMNSINESVTNAIQNLTDKLTYLK
jgi:hypothetical protein